MILLLKIPGLLLKIFDKFFCLPLSRDALDEKEVKGCRSKYIAFYLKVGLHPLKVYLSFFLLFFIYLFIYYTYVYAFLLSVDHVCMGSEMYFPLGHTCDLTSIC